MGGAPRDGLHRARGAVLRVDGRPAVLHRDVRLPHHLHGQRHGDAMHAVPVHESRRHRLGSSHRVRRNRHGR